MTAAEQRALADELVRAVAAINRSGNTDDDATESMIDAENRICDLLDISRDETEQGLTALAVARIELFVSSATGSAWAYDVTPMNDERLEMMVLPREELEQIADELELLAMLIDGDEDRFALQTIAARHAGAIRRELARSAGSHTLMRAENAGATRDGVTPAAATEELERRSTIIADVARDEIALGYPSKPQRSCAYCSEPVASTFVNEHGETVSVCSRHADQLGVRQPTPIAADVRRVFARALVAQYGDLSEHGSRIELDAIEEITAYLTQGQSTSAFDEREVALDAFMEHKPGTWLEAIRVIENALDDHGVL